MRESLREHRGHLAVLLAGVMLGALLMSPVGAHIGDSVSHLWGTHIKAKVRTFGDGRWAAKAHRHDSRYMRYGAGATLAPGQSETGAIAARENGATGGAVMADHISFQVPLGFTPTIHLVARDAVSPPAGCTGSAGNPGADPGHLCIFTGFSSGVTDNTWANYRDVADGGDCVTSEAGHCSRGLFVYAIASGSGDSEIAGTWVVRAPLPGATPTNAGSGSRSPASSRTGASR